MRIAIHNVKTGFHPFWIDYCKLKGINYKLVDCFKNDIMYQLEGCDALMWHHNHAGVKDIIFAKQLLFALEKSGKVVFPDINTGWHFDDKVGQKYLLESVKVDLVPTWVFFDRAEALDWIKKTDFPKVFKLRGGAGSANVQLVRSRRYAKNLVRRAFGSGFTQYDAYSNLKERFRKWKHGKTTGMDLLKGIARFVIPPKYSRVKGRERGYIYFQEFIPNNIFDIRVIVIDGKAFAIKRMTRDKDFRASGSGLIQYDKHHIDESVVKMSFNLARKLNTQSLAIDYIFQERKPLIVELSYGFIKEVYDPCPGYWSEDMNWIPEKINPCGWMVDLVVKSVKNSE